MAMLAVVFMGTVCFAEETPSAPSKEASPAVEKAKPVQTPKVKVEKKKHSFAPKKQSSKEAKR